MHLLVAIFADIVRNVVYFADLMLASSVILKTYTDTDMIMFNSTAGKSSTRTK